VLLSGKLEFRRDATALSVSHRSLAIASLWPSTVASIPRRAERWRQLALLRRRPFSFAAFTNRRLADARFAVAPMAANCKASRRGIWSTSELHEARFSSSCAGLVERDNGEAVSQFQRFSVLDEMPCWPLRPVPAITPWALLAQSAHGQAMTNTATH